MKFEVMKCERCGGKIVFKPIQVKNRKPALKGKRVCSECGYWPLAHVTHGVSPKKLREQAEAIREGNHD